MRRLMHKGGSQSSRVLGSGQIGPPVGDINLNPKHGKAMRLVTRSDDQRLVSLEITERLGLLRCLKKLTQADQANQ